jgi:hypothetical protein
MTKAASTELKDAVSPNGAQEKNPILVFEEIGIQASNVLLVHKKKSLVIVPVGLTSMW